ncbi:MAG: MmgE/PrpD family protein [Chloroflexota bacterium]
MNDTEGKTAIEAISANVVETRFEDFDDVTLDLAKKRVIDVLGCVIGGVNAPGNATLLDLIREWGGKTESTIFVHGGKAPAQNVAMLNAIMARSYDFEVMSYIIDGQVFPSHHAATLVPTALALGEAKKVSGKELLTAMLVGDDVAARVQAASAEHPIGLGWDGCGTLSHLGAAATAGRLLGLDPHRMRHAFGIVLNLIAAAIQSIWDGATTFKLGQGTAARHGIFAAELAAKGWTGVEDALQSRFGYFFLYARGCKDPNILTRDLGRKYYGEAYFKPYPCGMPNHIAINCALKLVKKYDINTDDIEEVILTVPPGALQRSYYAKPFIIREFPHGDAIFSYPYTVATALLRKSVGLPNFTGEAILDPRASELTARTKMIEPASASERWAITLKLKMKDGRELSESGVLNRDWTQKPAPMKQVTDKFWHQVDFSRTVSRKNAARLLEMLQNLEDVDDVSRVVRLMVA